MTDQLSSKLEKIDPKLRMIANGSQEVNAARAEGAPAVTVSAQVIKQLDMPEQQLGLESLSAPLSQVKDRTRRKLKKAAEDVFVDVYIKLKDDPGRMPRRLIKETGIRRPKRKYDLISASVALDRLQDLVDDPQVISVEIPEQIRFSPPLDVTPGAAAPVGSSRQIANAPLHEKAVLVGIVDVQGFDFAHPDFLDVNGETRFVRIWDQGGNTRPAPTGFDYGAEINQKQMNEAIKASKNPGTEAPATMLEPQSQMAPGSHGTHVASIAAGNLGVCPKAYLVGVLISLPEEDQERRKSFYDSSRIAHAVDYLLALGEELDVPVSINISLGTNGHAHDGSSLTSRWLDYELATAGRSVCIAAGNAGQEAPSTPDDWGYVMGRIHTSGKITKADDTFDIEWVVVGDGLADLSENELEIWYSPGDQFSVQVKPPGEDWLGEVKPGEFIENQMLKDGTFISIYNELYRPANGLNYIACYLSPLFSTDTIVGVGAGTWLVRLKGLDIREGVFHGWIERDDPRRLGRIGMLEAWRFPSFLSLNSNVDNSSVSSLACGRFIISVANLDEATNKIHKTSSQGPTRDERKKPEIAAPGVNISAANGFDDHKTRPWISMTGTSMASPYVTGLVGLMLAANRELTAAQIEGILRRTATPLRENKFDWRDDSGYGKINPTACLEEVATLSSRKDVTP
jgi:subtilisin family serine protease